MDSIIVILSEGSGHRDPSGGTEWSYLGGGIRAEGIERGIRPGGYERRDPSGGIGAERTERGV